MATIRGGIMAQEDQSKKMYWLRLYHELLHDKKIARIARVCRVERVVVVGAWTSILILASESPRRGYLFLAPDVPYVVDDLPEEIGINPETCQRLIEQFQIVNMLVISDEIICVQHFLDRQFESDSSTKRVREYRERNRKHETDDTETLQKRPCNADVTAQEEETETYTETNTYTEKETKKEKEEETDAPAAPSLFAQIAVVMQEATGMVHGKTQTDQVQEMADAGVPVAWLRRACEIADERGKKTCGVPRWNYIRGIIHNWQTNGYDGDKPIAGQIKQRAPTATTRKTVTMTDPFTHESAELEIMA